MGSGQLPTDSATYIPDSGSIQIIQPPLPTDKQGTLQPPPPTTSVAVTPATTLTPTSPQEGTGPHDLEAPPGPTLSLQSGAPPQSIASGGSNQTPAGSDHEWVTSRSAVKRRLPQTSKEAGSSGDNDGDDYLSSKKLRSELSPATTLPVKNENANTEKKSMTDHPPPMHEWEPVSSPHSVQSISSSVPSPHPSEDRNSDTEQYGTPPPSPGLQLSLSPSSTSFSSQPTNDDQNNTASTTNGTDVKSENVTFSKAKFEADRSERDSSKEVNLSTGPKPAAFSKAAGDQGQRQGGSQGVYHLQSKSNKQVEDNNNSSTSSTTSKSSTKDGKPPFSASNSLSDTSKPKDGTGAQGGAGTGPDNQQTSSIKSQKVGVLIVFYYVPI